VKAKAIKFVCQYRAKPLIRGTCRD